MRKGLFIILAALATTLCTAAARADTLDNILAAKKLRVAVLQDYPPYGFAGPDMQSIGLDIDIANDFARRLGVKVELTPVTGANRIPYLQTHKVDLIIGCLGKNKERAKVIDFSVPYALEFNGLYGPPEIKVGKAAELVGRTISVTRGSTEDLSLTAIAPAGAVIKRFDDNNGTLSAFLSGQVDLVVTGSNTAIAVMNKKPARRPELKFRIEDEPVFVGVNKEEPRLLKKVNDLIGELHADGSLAKMGVKWLGTPIPADLHE